MKMVSSAFLILLVCNLSFSQNKVENDTVKSNTTKVSVFKLYPNPVQDELFILGTNKIKSIELINALGKREAFYSFNKSIIKMDVSQIKSGIYLIQVIDENNQLEIKRLIVK